MKNKIFLFITIVLIIMISATLIIDITSPPAKEKAESGWYKILGFYLIFGFIGTFLLFFIAKLLGRLLVDQSEDYYD